MRAKLTEVFPELRHTAREIEHFQKAQDTIDCLMSQNNIRGARVSARALVFTILRDFREHSRQHFLVKVRERFGGIIDVYDTVEEYRYRQEYRAQTRRRGW